MKIIELLNKIANEEEIPDAVMFWDREYILDKEYNCYLYQTGGNQFIDLMDNNNDNFTCFLNDEVYPLANNWYIKNREYKKKYQQLLEKVNKVNQEMDELRKEYGIKKYNR